LLYYKQFKDEYTILTRILGILENTSKDIVGTTATVLGITINTVLLQACLLPEKLLKALDLIQAVLSKQKLSLQEVESLTGYLTWCSAVVFIGNLFLCYL
jgi:hypothetical protein